MLRLIISFLLLISIHSFGQKVEVGLNIGNKGSIEKLRLCNDYLLSISDNEAGEVKVLDTKTHKIVRTFYETSVRDAILLKDASKIFVAGRSLNVYSGEDLDNRTVFLKDRFCELLALSKDENYLACGYDDKVVVYDMNTFQEIAKLSKLKHKKYGSFMNLQFIDGTDLILIQASDYQSYVYNYRTGKELLSVKAARWDSRQQTFYLIDGGKDKETGKYVERYYQLPLEGLLNGDSPTLSGYYPVYTSANQGEIRRHGDDYYLLGNSQSDSIQLKGNVIEGSIQVNFDETLFKYQYYDKNKYNLEVISLESGEVLKAISSSIKIVTAFSIKNSDQVYWANGSIENWDVSLNRKLDGTLTQTSRNYWAFFSADTTVVTAGLTGDTFFELNKSTGKIHRILTKDEYEVKSRNRITLENEMLIEFGGQFADYYGNKLTRKQFYFSFIDSNSWVVYTKDGLFDASSEAMQLMYWTKGLEVIEFEQLKERYWVPGLWKKIMNDEPLPNVREVNKLKLYPAVELGQVKGGQLPITLTERGGGYGKVSVWINGKEVVNDARNEELDTTQSVQTISFSVKDHPYLTDTNTIEVRASSADGFVRGRGELLTVIQEEKEKEAPNFYAVIVGVDKYANETINLKYPSKDAAAIAKSLEMGAANLFGTEKSFVYSITSEKGKTPSKENIHAVFKEVSAKAKPEDVLLVYLSGHGITWGGDQGDFYFLTSDATASHKEAFDDPLVRQNNTVATAEMIEWIKAIPALKQVMMIDACGSGKAVDNLLVARDIEGSQIKAIDRMKDRTGMFVISGCAADAVSYEASQFGQGLLTYALLQAMKGAALRETKYIDVLSIMNHARETVPQLAEGLGGIQEPQLLVPKGGSFDIGLLSEEDKKAIPLAEPKQVFVRSVFIDSDELEDILGLSNAVDEALNALSSRGVESNTIWLDAKTYPNGCKITGSYTRENGAIQLRYKVRCGDEVQQNEIEAASVEKVIELLLSTIE